MEITHTKEINGLKITVTITRNVVNNTAYADGWNVDLGKGIYENTAIKLQKGEKSIYTSDLNFFYVLKDTFGYKPENYHPQAYARLGDSYIGKAAYEAVKNVLAEAEAMADAEQSQEFVDLKTASDAKKAAQDAAFEAELAADAARAKHPGWCDKCHSYCYGDCTASEEV